MKVIIDYLPHFLAIFCCNLFYDLCFAKMNQLKLRFSWKNICIMLGTMIVIFTNNLYNHLIIKTIITLGAMCINFKLLFNVNLKKAFIDYIVIFLILTLLEIIITNGLSYLRILDNSIPALYLTYIKLSLSLIVGLIEYLIFLIRPASKFIAKLSNFFYRNTNTLSIIYLILITNIILGILNIDNFANNDSIKLMFCLILIFTALFIIIIKSKTEEETLRESNKRLIDYNDKYSKFLDDYKIYKHNIKHKLAGIKAFGNKKVNALIDDILDEETHFSIKNNNLYNVSKGIKGIVAEKLYNANFDIIINNDIEGDPFSKLSPKRFNSISEALGIALDNAVEASEETTDPVIVMDLKETKEIISIRIGNKYSNEIDLERLGDKYYSTKNRGSGLGIFSIIQNKLVKEKIDIINDFYYIELQIKKHGK